MGGCNWTLLPVPVKPVSGCSPVYSVRDPTESLFWTTRRNNLLEVFWENRANGSSLVPSTTSLPKVCCCLPPVDSFSPNVMSSFQQKPFQTLTLEAVGGEGNND